MSDDYERGWNDGWKQAEAAFADKIEDLSDWEMTPRAAQEIIERQATHIDKLEAENQRLLNNVAWYKRQSEMWYKYYEKLQKIREMLDD